MKTLGDLVNNEPEGEEVEEIKEIIEACTPFLQALQKILQQIAKRFAEPLKAIDKNLKKQAPLARLLAINPNALAKFYQRKYGIPYRVARAVCRRIYRAWKDSPITELPVLERLLREVVPLMFLRSKGAVPEKEAARDRRILRPHENRGPGAPPPPVIGWFEENKKAQGTFFLGAAWAWGWVARPSPAFLIMPQVYFFVKESVGDLGFSRPPGRPKSPFLFKNHGGGETCLRKL
jgi:hypothetical protein